MLTVEELERWIAIEDVSKNFIARECGIDVRTVRNWFSSRVIPKKHQKRIQEIIASKEKTLHFVDVPLKHEHFQKLKKKTASENIPMDEYCARVIIDSL